MSRPLSKVTHIVFSGERKSYHITHLTFTFKELHIHIDESCLKNEWDWTAIFTRFYFLDVLCSPQLQDDSEAMKNSFVTWYSRFH